MQEYLLAIDQGTSSTRAIIFTLMGDIKSQHQLELSQHHPKSAWVEHDPEEIWQATLQVIKLTLEKANLSAKDILACGLTNQRETTVLWDKKTGKAIHPAIVWQDQRTADYCKDLQNQGYTQFVKQKTGLGIDPYFSASKIHWLLKHVSEAKHLLKQQQLAVGTIDSFLLWRLTKGKVHATDVTNASRTLLFDITKQSWDPDLLSLFEIPEQILPQVMPCNANFGEIDQHYFGESIPMMGIIGDQQSAGLGQACTKPGMLKSTYGTGCFMLLNTGEKLVTSQHGLLGTIAYKINDTTHYALEGSIFSAGTMVKWLRDNLGIIKHARDTEQIAASLTDNKGVYLIPAFTGLGAPYWDSNIRAMITGLSYQAGAKEIVRAALESVCYQTKDVIRCMEQESQQTIKQLRVDGGMTANNWLMQFLADILGIYIERPHNLETTSLGAALVAGLGCGYYKSLEEINKNWHTERRFKPQLSPNKTQAWYDAWLNEIKHALAN